MSQQTLSGNVWGIPASRSCPEDSRVRISVLPEKERDCQENDPGLSSSSCGLLKRSARDIYFLKMFPRLGQGDYGKSSKNLPKSGMMRNGTLIPLPDLAPTKEECERLLLPTLPASEYRDRSQARILARLDRGGRVARRICSKYYPDSNEIVCLNPCFAEMLMGFPVGWTELNVSEIPSSRSKSTRSSKRLQTLKAGDPKP